MFMYVQDVTMSVNLNQNKNELRFSCNNEEAPEKISLGPQNMLIFWGHRHILNIIPVYTSFMSQ